MRAGHIKIGGAVAAMALVAGVAACSSPGSSAGGGAAAGTTASSSLTVGFITVGSNSDCGYNQAVYAASQAVGKDLSNVKVLTADNIPENNSVTETMDAMANSGAKVIFATSYGYYSYALAFAKSHPGIIVLHQGGYLNGKFPANFGTY